MSNPEISVPDQFNMVKVLIDDHLEEGRASQPAVYWQGKTLTYLNLAEMVNRCGNALRKLGLQAEQRALIILNDSPNFLATFLGAMKIGAVPVPTNPLATPSDYEYFLNDSRAKVVVLEEEFLEKIEAVLSNLKFLQHVVVVGNNPRGHESFSKLLESCTAELECFPTHRDDASYWLYSSGTTGQPKGVVHYHGDMMYCVNHYSRHVIDLKQTDRLFSASKLFFSYGLVNSLYLPLLGGASVVLYPGRPEPESLLQVIGESHPTIFFSVPTSYAAILREMEEKQKPADLSSVRHCVSAGEALPPAILERWKNRFGLEILDGVGSTEGGYIFISNRPGSVRLGSSGKLIPGYEARLVDESGVEVKAGEVGDLLLRSPSTAAYYWHKKNKSTETFLGEWLRTGDKYYREEDGYHYFAGRSDDLFKVSGIWVSPIEIEKTLLEHDAVAECAVISKADENSLEKPRAFVVLKSGYQPGPVLVQELQAFVKQRLAPYKYPRWIEFVPELPRTTTGKVQRFKLRGGSNVN
ncbi:MAG TPA: benzoate-CoA ligase family protein [bacterium]|nr:benzoate-CoA ligase family protein [bacterium]